MKEVEVTKVTHASFITRGDAAARFEWEHDSASFYCPACNSVRCTDHWQIETVFEDDPNLSGRYVCTDGLYPPDQRLIFDS